MDNQLFILGKRSSRSASAPIWRATRWPFTGTVLEKHNGDFSWRLKLHPSFQSTEKLVEGVMGTAEEASQALNKAARGHVRALLWFDEDEEDDRKD